MRWFFFLTANFTSFAFPLSSKCNRAKGSASGPVDVTSSRGFAVQRGEACVGHQFVGNAVVGSKAKFSQVLSSDEQLSSSTSLDAFFFLAFNSASIVGVAFRGRP